MSDQIGSPPPQQGSGPPPAAGYVPPTSPGGPRAGFFKRLLAAIVDGIILGVIGTILGKIFGQDVYSSGNGQVSYSLTGAPALITLAISLTYYIYLEGSAAGQTLGKKLLEIRVIDFNTGAAIGYGSATVRWFGRLVSAIPCLLGYFWMLWDGNKQTWHDKFASSIVVPTSAYPVK